MNRGGAITGVGQIVLPAYLSLCLVFGGASAAGIIANATLQLLAIPILVFAAWQRLAPGWQRDPRAGRREWIVWALLALALAWPLLQLVPLPPTLWRALPGRDGIAAGDALFGLQVWRPISLIPRNTVNALLGWLPPLAVFALALRGDDTARKAAIATILTVAILSSMVGLMQIGQGAGSPFYFYEVTNSNTSVGFFANSNHLATLFLAAAAFSVDLPFQTPRREHRMVWRIVRACLFAFFLLNLALNRSVAGYLLGGPLLLYAMLRGGAGRWVMRDPARGAAVVAGVLAVGLLAVWVGWSHLDAIALNSTDPSRRLLFARNTLAIARDTFPFGTGLGTFRWVYAGMEDPAAVTLTFVNHAHNDYVELFSTLGVIAIILAAGFLLWLAGRAVALLRGEPAVGYAAPAALVLALFAGHSVVDYPLRTSAIASIAALCVALLLRSRPAAVPLTWRGSAQETPASAKAAR